MGEAFLRLVVSGQVGRWQDGHEFWLERLGVWVSENRREDGDDACPPAVFKLDVNGVCLGVKLRRARRNDG
jgi:hypothetical protein